MGRRARQREDQPDAGRLVQPQPRGSAPQPPVYSRGGDGGRDGSPDRGAAGNIGETGPIDNEALRALDAPGGDGQRASTDSLEHVVHGLIFYAALWLAARRWPVERRFLFALFIEATWEVVENTQMVIDYYRATTAALGYNGDSVINSLSDIAMMCIGFLLARKLPVWASIALLVLLELVPLIAIRDNLALNLLGFLAPNPAIQAWQAR